MSETLHPGSNSVSGYKVIVIIVDKSPSTTIQDIIQKDNGMIAKLFGWVGFCSTKNIHYFYHLETIHLETVGEGRWKRENGGQKPSNIWKLSKICARKDIYNGDDDVRESLVTFPTTFYGTCCVFIVKRGFIAITIKPKGLTDRIDWGQT